MASLEGMIPSIKNEEQRKFMDEFIKEMTRLGMGRVDEVIGHFKLKEIRKFAPAAKGKKRRKEGGDEDRMVPEDEGVAKDAEKKGGEKGVPHPAGPSAFGDLQGGRVQQHHGDDGAADDHRGHDDRGRSGAVGGRTATAADRASSSARPGSSSARRRSTPLGGKQ